MVGGVPLGSDLVGGVPVGGVPRPPKAAGSQNGGVGCRRRPIVGTRLGRGHVEARSRRGVKRGTVHKIRHSYVVIRFGDIII